VVGATNASGIGVYGSSTDGTGVFGYSKDNIAIEAEGNNGIALFASTGINYAGYFESAGSATIYAVNDGTGHGITVRSHNGIGVYSSSDTASGIWGQSMNQMGVVGEDSGNGVGVYGSSATGYAGYFAGKVGATSFVTVSDRSAKADIAPIDSSNVLEHISNLPITSWAFKNDPSHRHVGPMAQDFHAAFGLNGDDDTHINLADTAGVSLVAIQELNKRLKQKDAQIAALQAQLKAMNDQFSARFAKLEQRTSGTAGTATASLRSEPRVSALSETRE
jgi:hypothetical protein